MTKKISFILLFICFQVFGSELQRDFHSDYCTFLPVQNKAVKQCCYEHDLYYWAGGNKGDRNTIDLKFKSCIEKVDKKLLAFIMYSGVRLGSHSPWKFEGKQWGNAWGEEIRNEKLLRSEINLLQDSLTLQNELSFEEQERFLTELLSRQKKSYYLK